LDWARKGAGERESRRAEVKWESHRMNQSAGEGKGKKKKNGGGQEK